MKSQQELYIGLMSGTSADSIDAVVVDFSASPPSLIATHELPINQPLKEKILLLCQSGDNEIEQMGELDRELGHRFAEATIRLLATTNLSSDTIVAIGSHGQTIRHRPPGQGHTNLPFTLQIADPNTLAEITGITTVADFRRRDIAAGGQGAPLTPAFHAAVFAHNKQQRFIVNIGGMSNITQLTPGQPVIGFDTGPGNALMDGWINLQLNRPYDRNGEWAASGNVHQKLLQTMLSHPFLALPPPKSTGRESFNLSWLQDLLTTLNESIIAPDVQATLLEFTAISITNSLIECRLRSNNYPAKAFICGGGAYNGQLMHRLQQLAQTNYSVHSTAEIGIDPKWVEAIAFAWLARQTLNHRTGNLASVTGAKGQRVLGGIYYP